MIKTTFAAGDMKKALAFVTQVVELRKTMPVLNMIKITHDGQTATVSATDLDIELDMQIGCIEPTPFNVILPPRPLLDFFRPCAAGDIVSLLIDGDMVTLESDGCSIAIRMICQENDWPRRIAVLSSQVMRIDADLLHRALSACLPFVSKDPAHYYLNGVYFHKKDGLALVATNGHCLALYKTNSPWLLDDAIVPRKTVGLLQKAIAKADGQIEAIGKADAVGRMAMRFSGDRWSITSRIIDGTYPDYNRVIPTPKQTIGPDSGIVATLTAQALKRLPPVGTGGNPVKIDPAKGRMTIKVDDAISTAPVTGHGAAFGVNVNYLRQMTYPAGEVKLVGDTPKNPFIIYTADAALTQVLMPYYID